MLTFSKSWREVALPKFLARVTLNAEGVRLLRQDKGSGRRAAVTQAVEAAGGKVEAFYFAYGQDDTIVIADYPDAASATAVSLVGNSTGVVRVSMTPLITVEEMDRAVDKAATLPSPGPAR
jgi:uncharacterized protein with GYD domain